MKFLVLIGLIIIVCLFLKINIYIKYDQKFEIWIILSKILHFRINISKIIKKYIKLEKIKVETKYLKNKLVVSSYLIKDLIKRINIKKITLCEYSNVLNDRFILGIPFSMYYMNLIIKDNLEKYFKSISNTYYSLNLIAFGTNSIKGEIEINIRLLDLIIYMFKNFKLIFRRKINDRT